MSFVLYTQILKQSVLKPASPGITLRFEPKPNQSWMQFMKYPGTKLRIIVSFVKVNIWPPPNQNEVYILILHVEHIGSLFNLKIWLHQPKWSLSFNTTRGRNYIVGHILKKNVTN